MDRRPRIKESCDEMANDDILRRDGVLARITGFDEGRTAYYAVMPNGHSTQLTFPARRSSTSAMCCWSARTSIRRCRPLGVAGQAACRRNPPCAGGLRGHRDLGWSGIAGRRISGRHRARKHGGVHRSVRHRTVLWPTAIRPGSPTMMTTSSSTASRRAPIRRSRSRRSVGMSG